MYWCIDCDNLIASNFDYEKLLCKRCNSDNIINIPDNVKLTVGEMIVLRNISKDKEFIRAMIDLKEKDLIEYQLKMNQFKNQVQQQNSIQKQQSEQSKVHCPFCNSVNVKKISGTERVASVAVMGIFSKKINKSFKCDACGGTF